VNFVDVVSVGGNDQDTEEFVDWDHA